MSPCLHPFRMIGVHRALHSFPTRRSSDLYWEGAVPAISSTAAVLRRLIEDGVVEAHQAGPVVLAVHDHRSEEHTSELQSRGHLVCRLLLEKNKKRQLTVMCHSLEHVSTFA